MFKVQGSTSGGSQIPAPCFLIPERMIVKIDISPTCNIPSFGALTFFTDGKIPVGDVVLAEIPFEVRKSIVLTHGVVQDGKSGFFPGLPQ